MAEAYEFKRLKAICDGNGSEIREQFIYAGLLLAIFERFKKYVVDQVDGFFSDQVEIHDGDVRYKRGQEFKRLIKENGSHLPGQHGNSEFRAALHWFYDLGAITKDEFDNIERIYTLRNDIGHELFCILADDKKAPITLEDVLTTFSVYLKIVRWWIREIDATVDPDIDQETYENINWDEVESTDTVFLREIIRKALLGNVYWEQLQELTRSGQAASVTDTEAELRLQCT